MLTDKNQTKRFKTVKKCKHHGPVDKNQLLDRLLNAGYVIDERKNKSKLICL